MSYLCVYEHTLFYSSATISGGSDTASKMIFLAFMKEIPFPFLKTDVLEMYSLGA